MRIIYQTLTQHNRSLEKSSPCQLYGTEVSWLFWVQPCPAIAAEIAVARSPRISHFSRHIAHELALYLYFSTAQLRTIVPQCAIATWPFVLVLVLLQLLLAYCWRAFKELHVHLSLCSDVKFAATLSFGVFWQPCMALGALAGQNCHVSCFRHRKSTANRSKPEIWR
jgi:hypothetical protein